MFELNIDEYLQRQGVGSQIFKMAIEDYNPIFVKGVWKKLDIYTNGESVNLIAYKNALAKGVKPIDAVFKTPTGKILKKNGFDGIPELIKVTDDEVIVLFKRKY